MINIW